VQSPEFKPQSTNKKEREGGRVRERKKEERELLSSREGI
jgi:hypothetical protein